MAPSQRPPAPRNRPPATVQGNDLLYHFFQKTLLEEDPEQFRGVVSRLIVTLGVWLSPDAYRRFPLLAPYAVRDPKCRGDRKLGTPDSWGAPDERGLFRDDNSLIKGIPRSLIVTNSTNRLMHGARIGTGFVAAHVWRKLVDGRDAPRDPMTYSFLPNLVWLPSQLAKLSDREGGFAQTLLQAISAEIYRALPLTPRLRGIVDPIWDRLPVRNTSPEIEVPAVDRLNFFAYDENWLVRRKRTLDAVVAALEGTASGSPVLTKVISTRYGLGLRDLRPSTAAEMHRSIEAYASAVSEAGPSGGVTARNLRYDGPPTSLPLEAR